MIHERHKTMNLQELTLETANALLKNSPYFAMQGKRGLKFYKRYCMSRNDGYKISATPVKEWLAQ